MLDSPSASCRLETTMQPLSERFVPEEHKYPCLLKLLVGEANAYSDRDRRRLAWMSLCPSARPTRLEPGLNSEYDNDENERRSDDSKARRVRDSESQRTNHLLQERRAAVDNFGQHLHVHLFDGDCPARCISTHRRTERIAPRRSARPIRSHRRPVGEPEPTRSGPRKRDECSLP